MTRYFVERERRILRLAEEPTVYEVRKAKSYGNPHPPVESRAYSRKIVITAGGDPALPRTGPPTQTVEFQDAEYSAKSHDSNQAREVFEKEYPIPGEEIGEEEYRRLIAEWLPNGGGAR